MTQCRKKFNTSDKKHAKVRMAALEAKLSATAAAAAARAPAEQETDEERLWRDASIQGFAARSPFGLRFNRSATGGNSEEFRKGGLTNAQKAEFRKAWALANYKKVRLMKEKRVSWRTTDIRNGQYVPFPVIVEREGGNSACPGALEAAIQAAERYANRCAAMGGVWCQPNAMTGRTEYLYIRMEKSEIFEEAWCAYEQQHEDLVEEPKLAVEADAKAAATGEAETAAAAALVATPPKPAVDGAAGKGRASTDPEEEEEGGKPKGGKPKAKAKGGKPSPKSAKDKSPLEQASAQAAKLKREFQQAEAQYHWIVGCTQTAGEWAWAQNCLTDVRQAKLELDQSVSAFGRRLLCEDAKDIKRQIGDAAFIQEVAVFEKEVLPKVNKAAKEINMLLRMHRGRKS